MGLRGSLWSLGLCRNLQKEKQIRVSRVNLAFGLSLTCLPLGYQCELTFKRWGYLEDIFCKLKRLETCYINAGNPVVDVNSMLGSTHAWADLLFLAVFDSPFFCEDQEIRQSTCVCFCEIIHVSPCNVMNSPFSSY